MHREEPGLLRRPSSGKKCLWLQLHVPSSVLLVSRLEVNKPVWDAVTQGLGVLLTRTKLEPLRAQASIGNHRSHRELMASRYIQRLFSTWKLLKRSHFIRKSHKVPWYYMYTGLRSIWGVHWLPYLFSRVIGLYLWIFVWFKNYVLVGIQRETYFVVIRRCLYIWLSPDSWREARLLEHGCSRLQYPHQPDKGVYGDSVTHLTGWLQKSTRVLVSKWTLPALPWGPALSIVFPCGPTSSLTPPYLPRWYISPSVPSSSSSVPQ